MHVEPNRVPSRWWGAAGFLLGLAGAALCLALVPDSGFAARPQIISPRDDATVLVGHGRLVVRVKVDGRRGAKRARARFEVRLDGRDVTRRFRRVAADRWRGTIRPRPGFGLREHTLTAKAGRDGDRHTATVRFIAMKRDDEAAKITYRPDWRHRAGHLVRVRTKKRLWETGSLPKVLLNGHRVDRRLHLDDDGRGFEGGFGVEAGLRFGRNRLQVQTLQRNGVYSKDVRSFWVPRDRPLVGAGRDGRAGVGEPVRLRGTVRWPGRKPASGAATGADADRALARASTVEPPETSWHIVEAPAGSAAELEHPDAAEPILVPDVPGNYVLGLTATAPGGKPGLDEVTITAPQTTSPMGMPIQTIGSEGRTWIGGESFPRQASEVKAGVKLLVLSATALSPVNGEWGPAEQTFTPNAEGAWKSGGSLDLLEAIDHVGNDQTVILTGQGRPVPGGSLGKSQGKSLEEAIDAIGGTTAAERGQTPAGAVDLAGGDWSVIGRKGLTEGHANQSFFVTPAALPRSAAAEFPGFPTGAGSAGTLNGYMQLITGSVYEFISPEFLDLDTKWTPSLKEAPSTTANTIAVGAARYQSGTIPDGAIGMQLLVLDGSDPSQVLAQGTYTVLEANCATDYSGIYFLDQELHKWISPPAGATEGQPGNLLILQDFGHQSGWCWPGGNDTDWLQDTIPTVDSDGTHWVGSGYPTEPKQLAKIWNSANVHGFGSVAGNIGILGEPAAHDIVANYRRPFYDDAKKKMVNRDFGGLTVVASTDLYQPSSAFVQGQGDDPEISEGGANPMLGNGRVSGVLRRNEQSQWELANSAMGAGWSNSEGEQPLNQKALWDLVFREPTAWPCTPQNPEPCKGTPAEIAKAQRFFVEKVSPESRAPSLRDIYAEHFTTRFSESSIDVAYPGPQSGFSEAVFETLRKGVPNGTWGGLTEEMNDVNQVHAGIEAWQQFFITTDGGAASVDLEDVGGDVVSAVNEADQKLERENRESEMDGSIASDVLYAMSSIVDVGLIASGNPEAIPAFAPALGALGGMVALGDDAAEAFGGGASNGVGNVANDTEAIRGRIRSLSKDVAVRYANIAATMEHFGSVFVDDPVKLREADAHFDPGGAWSFPSTTTARAQMGRAMATSVQTAAYEATLPLAFTKWVVSPRHTTWDEGGSPELPAALDYQCPNAHGSGSRNPWNGNRTPSWALSSVGWSGGGPTPGTSFTPQNSANFLVSGLKFNINNLRPERQERHEAGDPDEPGLGHTGESAPAKLLEELFASPGAGGSALDPKPLGAAKEEIFGMDTWSTRKFQCGEDP